LTILKDIKEEEGKNRLTLHRSQFLSSFKHEKIRFPNRLWQVLNKFITNGWGIKISINWFFLSASLPSFNIYKSLPALSFLECCNTNRETKIRFWIGENGAAGKRTSLGREDKYFMPRHRPTSTKKEKFENILWKKEIESMDDNKSKNLEHE